MAKNELEPVKGTTAKITATHVTQGLSCGLCRKKMREGDVWFVALEKWVNDIPIANGHKHCVQRAVEKALRGVARPINEKFRENVRFMIATGQEYLAGEYGEEVCLMMLAVQMERILLSSNKVEQAILETLEKEVKVENENGKPAKNT